MIHINLITGFKTQNFIHQLDKFRYDGKIEFKENSTEDIVWDYVVVYESLPSNVIFKCKKGGLIFISGEPRDSNPYCKEFFNQFDHVISSHTWYKRPNHYLSQQALDYHFGKSFKTRQCKYNYESLKNMPVPQKKKAMSMMASSKRMMPGHVKRYDLLMELKRLYANKIDFYGDGVNFVDDKADSILPYMFHICIENSSVPHYWTEKIADSLLGYAVPIYYGAPNILDYFPQKAIIWLDLNNTKACVQTISEILEQPEKIYNEMLPYLLEARNKLLDEYNIFPTLEKFIMEHPTSDEVKNVMIKPYQVMKSFKNRLLRLRIRRLIFKWFHI